MERDRAQSAAALPRFDCIAQVNHVSWRVPHTDGESSTENGGIMGQHNRRSLSAVVAFSLLAAVDGTTQAREPVDTSDAATNSAKKPTGPTMTGVVVDSAGKPIARAIVTPRGYMNGDSGSMGPMGNIALPAVANPNGEFEIEALMPLTAFDVEVAAKGFVTRLFLHVPAAKGQKLELARGVTIVGRVVGDGKPLDRVAMTATTLERTSGEYWAPWTALTDAEGKFEIPNVTAHRPIYLYAKMSSLKGRGAMPREFFNTGDDESTLDVGAIMGDLQLQPGVTVSGKVITSDGRQVPKKSRVNLARENSVDNQIVEIADDGTFTINDVPQDVCGINLIGPPDDAMLLHNNYHLSDRNVSLQPQRRGSLVGQIKGDTQLTILIEPGRTPPVAMPNTLPEINKLKAQVERLQSEPLQGVPMDAEEKK
jgi:hypothetical protein